MIDINKMESESPITDQDKMMALLAYLIAIIVPFVILFSETGKERSFQKFHAIQALMLLGVIMIVELFLICPIYVVVSVITFGIGSFCFLPLPFIPYGITIYYGIKAYQGDYTTIPFLTDFAHNAGWL